MSSDSIINSSKDFNKKKRANRSAKLKQCKLDARREQWLSQVKNKGPKEEGFGNGRKGKEPFPDGAEVMGVNLEVIHNHDSDAEESSLTNSPTSTVNDAGNNYGVCRGSSTSRSSSASSLSFGSGGFCSGSMTEEEEGGGAEFCGDDGCLDDWEMVADALVGNETNDKPGHGVDLSLDEEGRSDLAPNSSTQRASGKGKSDNVEILDKGRLNNKAWRPDDAFRPQSLPNLSKQRNFPAGSERLSCHGSNPWVRKITPPVPTSCPICCEDLDLTDSNFLPCPCGFHLCLFCHKRILEEDSRCPGCRKPYTLEAVEKETSVSGGSMTIRLARSCSMFSRA